MAMFYDASRGGDGESGDVEKDEWRGRKVR